MNSPSLPRLSWALGLALLLSSCALNHKNSHLPALIVERLSWMDDVAEAKRAKGLPIYDPVREAELLRTMTQRGVAAGLKEENVRRFFTGQMQAAKVVQEEWLQQHPQGVISNEKVPDLKQTVRPALDAIGQKMITSLATQRSPAESAAALVEACERLARAGYSKAASQRALKGLEAGLAP
ncbi:MAG: gamma subclass chorismate mutase AroQ [Verrucomicrobia bacterium]|nr:gamma subclass chorismate mutase AroQ [Verrucomicrobiota bacterium]